VPCPVPRAEALYYCAPVTYDKGSSYPGLVAIPEA